MARVASLICLVLLSVGCGNSSSDADDSASQFGAGASGGSGGSAADSGTASDGGADCAALEQTFIQAFSQGQSCNTFADGPQCSEQVSDYCGCRAWVNSDAAAAVREAYDRWVAADCGPQSCEWECPTGTSAICYAHKGGYGMCQPVTR